MSMWGALASLKDVAVKAAASANELLESLDDAARDDDDDDDDGDNDDNDNDNDDNDEKEDDETAEVGVGDVEDQGDRAISHRVKIRENISKKYRGEDVGSISIASTDDFDWPDEFEKVTDINKGGKSHFKGFLLHLVLTLYIFF